MNKRRLEKTAKLMAAYSALKDEPQEPTGDVHLMLGEMLIQVEALESVVGALVARLVQVTVDCPRPSSDVADGPSKPISPVASQLMAFNVRINDAKVKLNNTLLTLQV